MVMTGGMVLAALWKVAGSNPPATTGTFPKTASFDRSGFPLLGRM